MPVDAPVMTTDCIGLAPLAERFARSSTGKVKQTGTESKAGGRRRLRRRDPHLENEILEPWGYQ
jgi:hypothetical protein